MRQKNAGIGGDLVFFGSVSLLGIGLLVLFFVFTGTIRNRDNLLVEYEASRISAGLFEEWLQTGSIDTVWLDGRITSAGVYSSRGEALLQVGDAPAQLPDDKLVPTPQTTPLSLMPGMMDPETSRYRNPAGTSEARETAEIWWEDDRLTVVRPLGMPRNRMNQMRLGAPGPNQWMRDQAITTYYLYLQFSPDGFKRESIFMNIAIAAIPGGLVAFFGLIIVLYVRNRRYQRKETHNRELVQLGEAARVLAHEMKNPLGIIRIETGTLLRTVPENSGRESVLVINSEVSRLSQLIDRIGDFLRSPLGSPEHFNPASEAELCLAPYRERIILSLPNESRRVIFMDKQRYHSILNNLVSNALESLPEGQNKDPAAVRVEMEEKRNSVEMRVIDTGCGIDLAHIARVCDPFFTTKIRGTGIGLALVKRFVESAGGSLAIHSTPGVGTRITIILPTEVPA